MSEKRYQISPIELVQWAEPLFGFGEGKATGFSEKTIAAYETAAGIRLPAALRDYYRACGKASLNCALHEIFIPDRVGGYPLVEQPTSHTTVRTVRYTAVQ